MRVASIVFASPLPQLSKEFDYSIPSSLEDKISFGSLVAVPFGTAKKPKTGFVVAIKNESSFAKELAEVSSVLSERSVLTIEQYELCKAIAKRQAGLVGELLSTAVPKLSVRADKVFGAVEPPERIPKQVTTARRTFITPGLLDVEEEKHWSTIFLKIASENLSEGRSVIIVAPDFRELEVLESVLTSSPLSDKAVRISSEDSLTERWKAHLRASSGETLITYGTRGAVFAPSSNLGAILVWDDGDDSHFEQGAPYWNTRDVALTRSELESCDIVFAAHSPSAEASRLIEIGYLQHEVFESSKPPVRISESNERLDEETYSLISKILSSDKPVLIQVSNLGYASAIACLKCKEIRRCQDCNTALWIDPNKIARCRSCKNQFSTQCECGGSSYRPISVGSQALTDQLSRSFPKANVIHTSGLERITRIERKGTLVISTPGAEPSVSGGYELIVFSDSLNMIGMPRLRALENACSKWSNALAKISKTGRAIYVGITGDLADQIRSSNFHEIVHRDVLERGELGLPPSTRTLSITSSSRDDLKIMKEQLTDLLPEMRLVSETATTIAFNYSIASGAETAATVWRSATDLTRASKNKKPGQRVFFVNMDDNKVI